MPEITAPPKWILFLLWPFKGESCYPQIEGDLSEEFQQLASKNGRTAARGWYRREVCRSVASLTFRWATIAAIALPLLCLAFKNSVIDIFLYFSMTIVKWFPTHDFMTQLLIFILLSTGIKGLAFGMICSAPLRGHERMVRIVFTAYYLGFWAIWGINHSHALIAFRLANPESWIPLLGFPMHFHFTFIVEPVWILAFFWYGSTWVERHHCRKATGGYSSPASTA
jgi:hypothetical protein